MREFVFWSLVIALLPAGMIGAEEQDWPQWRGPRRSGEVASTPAWPRDFRGLKPGWSVELGPSYSGPIVADGMVFVTETVGEQEEVVRALDRQTGAERWRRGWTGSMKVPFFAAENGSWIRSTPAYDDGLLFVGGMRDVLVALDARSGEIRWRIDFVEQFQTSLPTFGFVSSPMVVGPNLYVQAGGGFCKIDKASGRILWRTLDDGGGMMGSAFSSPVIESLHGREQLLVQTRTKLAGVAPENGDVLWTQDVPNFRGMNILTPIAYDGAIFTSSYNHKSFLYRLDHDGKSWSTAKAWENKLKGYMSTPILIDGHVYMHLQNQRLACLDLERGKETWITSRRFGKYWSMVSQGNLILGLDQDGRLYLMEANPSDFKLLAEKPVSDQETWGHLAVAGRDLFIRELHRVRQWTWDETD